MNWLDILLLAILAGSIVAAFRKGLSRQLIGLASVVLALLLGSWFYGMAGAYLLPYVSSRAVSNFGGFAMVFFAVIALGALAGFAVGKFLKVTGLSFFDRVLGAGFGAVRGVLLAVALILAILAFAPDSQPPQAVVHSRTAPYVVGAARVVAALAPHELKEGFRKTYAKVQSIWESMRNGKENERHI